MSENDDPKKIAIPALNPKEITFDKHGAYELEEIVDPYFLDEVGGGKGKPGGFTISVGDIDIVCPVVIVKNTCSDNETDDDEE